jgi:outer membrane protein assembly factor BamB
MALVRRCFPPVRFLAFCWGALLFVPLLAAGQVQGPSLAGVVLGPQSELYPSAAFQWAGHGYFATPRGQILRIDLATGQRAGTLRLPGQDHRLVCVVAANGLAYFGSDAYGGQPGRIVKVDLRTFTWVETLPLGADESFVKGAAVAGGFAYFATRPENRGTEGKIVKIDLASFERVGALQIKAGGPTSPFVRSGALYFGATGSNAGAVVKVNLSNFRVAQTFSLQIGETDVLGAARSGDLAYFVVESPLEYVVRVIRVDLASFTRTGELTSFHRWIPYRSPCAIAISGQSLYVMPATERYETPFARVDLSSFTEVETDPLDRKRPWAAGFAYGSSVYFADRVISRIPQGTLTEDQTLPLFQSDRRWRSAGAAEEHVYFGAGFRYESGQIIRIHRDTDVAEGLPLSLDEEGPNCAVAHGGYVYFGLLSGSVVKIDRGTFTRVGAVSLAEPPTAVLHCVAWNGNAYFWSGDGKLTRLDLASFTPGESVSVPGTFKIAGLWNGKLLLADFRLLQVDLATMTPGSTTSLSHHAVSLVVWNDHAYIAAPLGGGSDQILKVDLINSEQVDTLALDPDETFFDSATLVGSSALFGSWNAGRVVEVDLRDFKRVGAVAIPQYIWSAAASGGHGYFGSTFRAYKIAPSGGGAPMAGVVQNWPAGALVGLAGLISLWRGRRRARIQ